MHIRIPPGTVVVYWFSHKDPTKAEEAAMAAHFKEPADVFEFTEEDMTEDEDAFPSGIIKLHDPELGLFMRMLTDDITEKLNAVTSDLPFKQRKTEREVAQDLARIYKRYFVVADPGLVQAIMTYNTNHPGYRLNPWHLFYENGQISFRRIT